MVGRRPCIRLSLKTKNHLQPYGYVHIKTHDGRALYRLNVPDEYTSEWLGVRAQPSTQSF